MTVFRHEDLSGEFSLDGEGYFALPLVGEILGGGRTARQLENEIEVALKSGGYLIDPQVSIEVLNYRPFYIIGEVNKPGSFEYVNGMTVINAVALAGGYTYRADQDDIIISRGGSNGPRIAGAAGHRGAAGRHHRGHGALLLRSGAAHPAGPGRLPAPAVIRSGVVRPRREVGRSRVG